MTVTRLLLLPGVGSGVDELTVPVFARAPPAYDGSIRPVMVTVAV